MKAIIIMFISTLLFPLVLIGVNLRGWRLQEKIQYLTIYSLFLERKHYEYYYNSSNPEKVDSISYYSNNGDPPIWEHILDYHYTYDGTGNNMLSISEFYYHAFYNDSEYAQYDEENRIIFCSRVGFSGESSARDVQISYTEGKITSFDWQSGGTYFKMSVDYGVDERIAEMTQYYSNDSLQWQSSYKTTYTYSTQDTSSPSGYVDFVSRNLLSQSFGPSDDLLTCFDYGMILEKRDYYFMSSLGIWFNYQITNYTYDSANRLVTRQYQNFNAYESEWYTHRYDFSYDYYTHNLEYLTEQTAHDGVWDDYARTDYFWETYTQNDDDMLSPTAPKLSAYPNPFAGSLNINLQSKSNAPVQEVSITSRGKS
jgi:hypothetical protein